MSDLRGFTLAQLQQLLGLVQAGELRCPIKRTRLLAVGLESFVGKLEMLDGLEQSAVLALLRAVIAERLGHRTASLDLVWTGPDPEQGLARDTTIVVRELFALATREVIIGGCYFSGGREILQPLHTAMLERQVKVTFCMDVGDKYRVESNPLSNAQRCAVGFMRENWYFGHPVPDFYFDPRTAKSGDLTKLHAKCIVVDDRWSLLTSANFTYLGQHRNIEAGVLIDDPTFSSKLARQWRHLIREHKLQRCPLPNSFPISARVVPEGWSDAEEYLDSAWRELASALIEIGVPGPDDYAAELTMGGVTIDLSSLMHWGQGPSRVSLVAAEREIQGVDGTVVYVNRDTDLLQLAARVAETLGVKP